MTDTLVEHGIIHMNAMYRPEAQARRDLMYRLYLKMLLHKRRGE